jgi:hypothetical protein
MKITHLRDTAGSRHRIAIGLAASTALAAACFGGIAPADAQVMTSTRITKNSSSKVR